ncbi:MAG: hypothetical protein H6707_17720 [Deltaproteobacteria bacterium]|nr:hypothetical protein [Deltaproteobacteria bacterium]
MTICATVRSMRVIAFSVLLAGCGATTAIDLSLIADTNISDAEQLLAEVDVIDLVLDSDQGLYPLSAAAQYDNITISDVDNDGSAELTARFATNGLDHLPLIRVERGSLTDVPLAVSLRGLQKQTAALYAAGGLRGAMFSAGRTERLSVPFNVVPRFRPPQVSQVVPGHGSSVSESEFSGPIFIFFTKLMDQRSLLEPSTITLNRISPTPQTIAARQILLFQDRPGDDPTITMTVEFHLSATLSGGTYEVKVSSAAVDTTAEHRPLDQAPMQPGNQGWRSTFVIAAGALKGPDPVKATQCGSGPGCPVGTRCEPKLGRCEPTACPASCPQTLVCDSALNRCVQDCRLYGGATCPATAPLCSSAGLCRPQS